jgi:hypothetical protein
MIKLIGINSIYLIGKVRDIRFQLASIDDKSITLAEYIKQQTIIYQKSLN